MIENEMTKPRVPILEKLKQQEKQLSVLEQQFANLSDLLAEIVTVIGMDIKKSM